MVNSSKIKRESSRVITQVALKSLSQITLPRDLMKLSEVLALKQKTRSVMPHKLDFLIEYCHAPARLSHQVITQEGRSLSVMIRSPLSHTYLKR